jgi:hypothetical protein
MNYIRDSGKSPRFYGDFERTLMFDYLKFIGYCYQPGKPSLALDLPQLKTLLPT